MTTERIAYTFAYLRVVPRVHLGAFVNVGVVLQARTAGFVGLRVLTDAAELERRVPHVDVPLLVRYLESLRAIADGEPTAGPVALGPPSERFHWLTSPRSDVLQCSPVHAGVTDRDPAEVLDRLYEEVVGP
ncbi:MAG: DUF3037 domain-containing protein [Gemmatimonadetes bacterium]|nr:DUF3037 domain-containing protein [Gemmatimonadota bacterium]MBT8405781.1 DUF3037 domain-containing protein [Gemmatimonadota bacterium]NNK62110.1 DUF3037 domain-containing protein [Gemmatimonadota bacterium]